MTLTAEGKILENKKKSTFYVSIRARVFRDSEFPFKAGEKVDLEIQGNRLIVSKKPDEEKEQRDENHPTT